MSITWTVVRADGAWDVTPILTTTCDDWRAAITLVGEFDIANAADLRDVLTSHLDAGRRLIRVDAAGVEFMDSTAIGELICASERCRAEHGSLILTNVPPRMRRLITIAGLESMLLVDYASSYAHRDLA